MFLKTLNAIARSGCISGLASRSLQEKEDPQSPRRTSLDYKNGP